MLINQIDIKFSRLILNSLKSQSLRGKKVTAVVKSVEGTPWGCLLPMC